MKCSYNNFDCTEIDTTTMTLQCGSCDKCSNYNNGVRATGAIINFKIFKKLRKRILMDFFKWQYKKFDFYPQNKMVFEQRVDEYLK